MIQGWTPDFVPEVLDRDIPDQLEPVNQDLAKDTALALAQAEGIFTGVSGGATLAAALSVARDAKPGSVFCVMLPDTGERYLSTFMFEGINEGSDDEWLASL
jgi:cysteine synthase A